MGGAVWKDMHVCGYQQMGGDCCTMFFGLWKLVGCHMSNREHKLALLHVAPPHGANMWLVIRHALKHKQGSKGWIWTRRYAANHSLWQTKTAWFFSPWQQYDNSSDWKLDYFYWFPANQTASPGKFGKFGKGKGLVQGRAKGDPKWSGATRLVELRRCFWTFRCMVSHFLSFFPGKVGESCHVTVEVGLIIIWHDSSLTVPWVLLPKELWQTDPKFLVSSLLDWSSTPERDDEQHITVISWYSHIMFIGEVTLV